MFSLHQSVLSFCVSENHVNNNRPQFIAQAEDKISQCITIPLDPEPQMEQICGPGIDPNFDQLISALGHIACQKPKPLIDSMMLWRKNKSDAANEARIQLQLVSGNTSSMSDPLLKTQCSLKTRLYRVNYLEGIQSPPICYQTMPLQRVVNHRFRHVKSLLLKRNVDQQLPFIYCAEF